MTSRGGVRCIFQEVKTCKTWNMRFNGEGRGGVSECQDKLEKKAEAEVFFKEMQLHSLLTIMEPWMRLKQGNDIIQFAHQRSF